MNKSGTLVQLCKAPVLGKVKTRLTPFLSDEQACSIHKQLAFYIFKRLVCSPCFDTLGLTGIALKYQLWIDCEHAFFDDWVSSKDYPVFFQNGISLGDRLIFAGEKSLEQSDFVMFIGSDCPFISIEDLGDVSEYLFANNDVVIIPAEDGGYVLIAIKTMHRELFENIDWGSEHVLSQTLISAKEQGLDCHLMAAKSDIDRPDDLPLLDVLNDFPVK